MSNLASPKVIREQLSRIGKTAADIARELDVPTYTAAGVIAGRIKGRRGEAHKVAVALGLKEGVIVDDSAPVAEAIRAALAA